MAQQTFNDGEQRGSIRAKLNSNANDVETRLTDINANIDLINNSSDPVNQTVGSNSSNLDQYDTYLTSGTHDAGGANRVEIPYTRSSQGAATTWTDRTLILQNLGADASGINSRINSLERDVVLSPQSVSLGGSPEIRLTPVVGSEIVIGSSYEIELSVRFNTNNLSGSANSLSGYYGSSGGVAFTSTQLRLFAAGNGGFLDFDHGIDDLTTWNSIKIIRQGSSIEMFVNNISVGVLSLDSGTVEDAIEYIGAFNSELGTTFNTGVVMQLGGFSISSTDTNIRLLEDQGLIANGGAQQWQYNIEPSRELLSGLVVGSSVEDIDESPDRLLTAGLANLVYGRSAITRLSIAGDETLVFSFDPTEYLKSDFPTVVQLDIDLFYTLASSSGRSGTYKFYYQRFLSEILEVVYERHEGISGSEPTLTAEFISTTEVRISITNNFSNNAETYLRIR